MTVEKLSEAIGLEVISLPHPEREITDVYIGDLLSWVMGRAMAGNAWITIMSNANILAVATLADVACIILAEGVTLDGDIVRTAMEKGVNVLSSTL
jgi:hypothetical protein